MRADTFINVSFLSLSTNKNNEFSLITAVETFLVFFLHTSLLAVSATENVQFAELF